MRLWRFADLPLAEWEDGSLVGTLRSDGVRAISERSQRAYRPDAGDAWNAHRTGTCEWQTAHGRRPRSARSGRRPIKALTITLQHC